ncbi:MAG: sugar ABC transporter ATP-binding protein [Acetobacteraceae bacterium]
MGRATAGLGSHEMDQPPSMTGEPAPILQVEKISKRYGPTQALSEVSFILSGGEVCGLLGENGAGKSTLVKALSGVVLPDSGAMHIMGDVYRPRDRNAARRAGVATAFQELSLVPTLSAAVNLFLPHPPVNALGLISSRRIEQDAKQVFAGFGVDDIHPAALVGELALGQRQRLEIMRAMFRRPRLLLLDEPTAALSDREWLFALIGRAVGEGTAILYISHKLDEIRRLCRRCVILRNGRKVLDRAVSDMSEEDIFHNMAGRSAVERFVDAPSSARDGMAPALAVSHLAGGGIEDVSFVLCPGEILGVAGLEGHGQARLFRALVGLHPVRSGTVALAGRSGVFRSPAAARQAGLVLVPEERKTEGIFKDLTTTANISLPKIRAVSPGNFLSRRRERKLVDAILPGVDLAEHFLPLSIAALSGGNQQKAVLARALITEARCLLLFDPTRGVDVGAKQSVYRMMRNYVQHGGAILFYSTELDELVHLSDRCLVMYRYRIAGEVSGRSLTQDSLLSLAAGRGQPAVAETV